MHEAGTVVGSRSSVITVLDIPGFSTHTPFSAQVFWERKHRKNNFHRKFFCGDGQKEYFSTCQGGRRMQRPVDQRKEQWHGGVLGMMWRSPANQQNPPSTRAELHMEALILCARTF